MRKIVAFGPSLVVLLTVVFTLMAAPAAIRSIEAAQTEATIARASNTLEQGTVLDQLSAEVEAIAEATFPGVVHIEVNEQTTRFISRRSNGAGWVYDQQGHIITNAHVVGEAERVRVELFDGRVEWAQVIGRDPQTDIAVVKIDPGAGVFPLRRGTALPLHVGARVFAFGSPFGIKFSMTQGIVSGLGRSEAASFLGMIQGYTNFIQTDAAMNPGNSGGPLVDSNARVVGMNAAIANNAPSFPMSEDDDEPDKLTPEQRALRAQPLGQSAGIGFAIPLETVESVVQQLLTNPAPVLRGYLGIRLGPDVDRLRDFDPEDLQRDPEGSIMAKVAREFHGAGVVVGGAQEGEPAAQAGLKLGDIILQIGPTRTPNVDVLRSIVSIAQPGTTVPVVIWRDGKQITLDVRLGAAYNTPGGTLRYVPGTQNMSLDDIREWIAENR